MAGAGCSFPAPAFGLAGWATSPLAQMPLQRTQNVVSVSTGYTARLADDAILCDCAAAGFQVTLPAPASVPGKQFSILKVDATVNVLVVAGASGNVNGSATKNTGTQFAGWTLVSDGSNYWILV